jgi:choline dehydrogenase-like flavoprotein
MTDYLASIYKDLYKVRNARYNYKDLYIRTTDKFTEFQTRFLQLAGQACIPSDDLMPDLFDKPTLELCCTILPQYSTMTSFKQLTDQCQAVDQGLRRIKAEAERTKRFAENYRPQKSEYTSRQRITERRRNVPVRPAESMRAPVCNGGSVP